MKNTEKKFNLIFVCTGNTCRSPMAEYMFKAYLRKKKQNTFFEVDSAGLYAHRGDVISKEACEALDALGILHPAKRRVKPLTALMADCADLIVTMTADHARLIRVDNVISYEKLTGFSVSDPFGGSLDDYISCAKQIASGFDNLYNLCKVKL